MSIEKYQAIIEELKPFGARLVAVSKTQSIEKIEALYKAGQRIFGENKVQETLQKKPNLPADIEWHLIGHLQTNKVKQIAPFISMIQSVDSLKLLAEINKQAQKNKRVINCLLQVFIADEKTKFGLSNDELMALLYSSEYKVMQNICICGLMGMATNTDNETKIAAEFKSLHSLFLELKQSHFKNQVAFKELSMGMSSDYKIALKEGATLVRIGSLVFGERNYNQ